MECADFLLDIPVDPEEGSMDRGLARLAEQVASCNPVCCGAAATLSVRDSAPAGDREPVAAVTHPDLAALVAVQWETGEGPIPAALEAGRPAVAEDLLYDGRWPSYRAKALDAGVRSSTTLPFRRRALTVTLTVYGFRPGPLDGAAHGVTALLGDLGTTGLVRDHQYRQVLAEIDQLDTALRSRPVVDQACGIIMYVLACGPDTAFSLLRRMSQRTNRKLSELAEALVRTRGRGTERDIARLAEQLHLAEQMTDRAGTPDGRRTTSTAPHGRLPRRPGGLRPPASATTPGGSAPGFRARGG